MTGMFRMPDNIIPFRSARKKPISLSAEMHELLSRIDELEELLEALDELGVSSRTELVDLISRLESEAAALDAPPES